MSNDVGEIATDELTPTMSATIAPEKLSGTVRVHRRELRLVSERLVLARGVSGGAAMACRDFVLAAVERWGAAALEVFSIEMGVRAVDGEISATTPESFFCTAPFRIAGALGRSGPDAPTEWIQGAGPFERFAQVGDRWRLGHSTLLVEFSGGQFRVRVLPDAPTSEIRALAGGLEVPAQLWWPLYFASNAALSVESELSRRHTGLTPPVSGYL